MLCCALPLIAQYWLAPQMAGCSRQEQTNDLEPPKQPRSAQEISVTGNCDSTARRYLGSPNYKFKGSDSRRDRNWSNRPWINLQEEDPNERTPADSNGRGCLQFTLASYNLLAQSLLEKNPDLYTHCPPALLAWEHRRQRLLDELIHYNADVSTTSLFRCLFVSCVGGSRDIVAFNTFHSEHS